MERPVDRAARTLQEARGRYRILTGLAGGLSVGIVITLVSMFLAFWGGYVGLAWDILLFLALLMVFYGLVLFEVPQARKRYLDAVRVQAAYRAMEVAERLSYLQGTETSWGDVSGLVDELRERAREHPQVQRMMERLAPAVREYRQGRWTRKELADHLQEQAERLLLGQEPVAIQKEES